MTNKILLIIMLTRFLEIRCNPWKGREDLTQVKLVVNFINTLRNHETRFTNHRRRRGEMKKFIVLCLAGLLILAFSAPGYAQAPKLEFKASGYIDTQTFIGEGVPQYNSNPGNTDIWGVVNKNYALTSPSGTYGIGSAGWNRTQSNWEGRAHLKFDAVMGPNLSGTIYFEIDTYRWGAPMNSYGAWTREANNFGSWTTDRTAIEVKNIYIDVGLPYFGIPVPITVRVGAQPLGVRPNMLMYTDGTGVTGGIKIDPVLIAPIYAKALENLDFADDDVDVWGLHANAKIRTFTVGAYGLCYRMNTYPFYVQGATVIPAGVSGNTGLINQVPGTFKSHMWWLGAYVDGKAGPVNFNYDFVYDYGSVDERLSPNVHNVKYEGWATRLKADYPWEKFNFGVVGMYATGADTRRTSSSGLPGSLTAGLPGAASGRQSTRVTSYVIPPGAEQSSADQESIVVYGMENGASGGYGIAHMINYGQVSRGGFGGTWFAKLYGSAKLLPWYKVTLQGLYIGDTTGNGNTLGNAVKYKGASLLRDDNSIGFELDLMNDIQIYNNLRFWVGAGYLFAGNALDINNAGSGVNHSAANPWAIRTRLVYTF